MKTVKSPMFWNPVRSFATFLLIASTFCVSVWAAGSGGTIQINGGSVEDIEDYNDLTNPIAVNAGQVVRLETDGDVRFSTAIKGDGGLQKYGTAALNLTGTNLYRGETRVHEGLLVNDGSLDSKTYVENGAALAGKGYIYNDVYFLSGSAYQWDFGFYETDSPYLTVAGDVNLSGAIFRPVTAGTSALYPDVIENWTILRYAGQLTGDGAFAEIDNSLSPFYDFILDYSLDGYIKATGYHRRDPRPLSDSVAMSIVMAQRRVHRRAFDQIDKELQPGRDLGLRSIHSRNRQVRGQSPRLESHVWADMYGRTTEFESSYHTTHPWRLNGFGVQVGYSFLSSNWLTLGLTAGAETSKLKNFRDQVNAMDGYIGLYYGQRIYGMWELKGYIGGGTQRFKSWRDDTKYIYRTKYHGDSFETSVELGRPFLMGALMVRPHFGFDFEYAGNQGSTEDQPSNEFRTYSDVSLTQMFFRIGIDVQRAHQRGDSYLGVSYSNMIGGQSLPQVYVYYPSAQSGTTCYGTKLGQNIFTVRGGGNLYVDESRSRSVFLNLTGDVFADREDGKVEFTASLGYDYRY